MREILSREGFELKPEGRPRSETSFDPEPLLFILGISIAGAALILLGLGIRASLTTDRSVEAASEARGGARMPSSEEMFEELSRLEREGDLQGVVRAAYLAALLRLHEKGLLRYDPSATDGEYLEQLSSDNRIHTLFSRLSQAFAEVRYGHRRPDPEMARMCRSISEEIRGMFP